MASVNTPSKRYEALAQSRKLARTLMGGTKAMIAAGTEFTPKHPAEEEASYKVRLHGTTLYNGFKQTVQSMVGKVFSSPVIVGDDVPPLVALLLDNIDGQGRELTPFSMDVLKEAMVDGVSFVLVDFPVLKPAPGQTVATLADQIASGARPYCIQVTAENLIGWKSENVGGVRVLSEARIKECTVEADGEWGEKEVERVRVLRPNYFMLYVKKLNEVTKEYEYVLEDEGSTLNPFVPLVAFYTNRVGFFEGEPPLQSLAELNLEHWISSSEQRRALTFARFAMLVLSGVAKDVTVKVGPDKVIKLQDPQAKAAYVEPSGAAIEAGASDIKDIQERMQHAGMTVRVERAGTVTATASAIDSADSNAALKAIADAFGDSMELVLSYIAFMLGITTGGGTLEVNDDFGEPAPQGSVTELSSLALTGMLSQETLLSELKRRSVLSDDVNVQDEIERISGQYVDTAGSEEGE